MLCGLPKKRKDTNCLCLGCNVDIRCATSRGSMNTGTTAVYLLSCHTQCISPGQFSPCVHHTSNGDCGLQSGLQYKDPAVLWLVLQLDKWLENWSCSTYSSVRDASELLLLFTMSAETISLGSLTGAGPLVILTSMRHDFFWSQPQASFSWI